MEKVLLGCGPLGWTRHERHSDRYGSIYLHPLLNADNKIIVDANTIEEAVKKYSGKKGKLIAEVAETRQSDHVGDWTHGFFHHTPAVGVEIELGEGTLFFEITEDQKLAIGVKPADNRDTFWLNPQHVYNCHMQTVRLFFCPQGGIS